MINDFWPLAKDFSQRFPPRFLAFRLLRKSNSTVIYPFLAPGHSLKKISSKISSLQATQNKPFIGAPKFFHNILMFYTEKCVTLYATRVGMT